MYMDYIIKWKPDNEINQTGREIEQLAPSRTVTMSLHPMAMILLPDICLLINIDYRSNSAAGLTGSGYNQYSCHK